MINGTAIEPLTGGNYGVMAFGITNDGKGLIILAKHSGLSLSVARKYMTMLANEHALVIFLKPMTIRGEIIEEVNKWFGAVVPAILLGKVGDVVHMTMEGSSDEPTEPS